MKTSSEFDSQIQNLYNKHGLNINQIARKLGQAVEFIERRMNALGLCVKEFR